MWGVQVSVNTLIRDKEGGGGSIILLSLNIIIFKVKT